MIYVTGSTEAMAELDLRLRVVLGIPRAGTTRAIEGDREAIALPDWMSWALDEVIEAPDAPAVERSSEPPEGWGETPGDEIEE